MKYPTRNGLIISPYELDYTEPTQADIERKRTTMHHGWWTARDFGRTAIGATFRALETNVYPMLRNEHNQGTDTLHDKYSPPPMPHVGLMVDVLDEYLALHGVIDLVREKSTSEIREMSADQWNQTRLDYRSVQ